MYTAKGKLDQENNVEKYLPMVRRQALSLQVRLPSSIELDDLIQAGVLGLIEAMGRFDDAKGASFATFASQRVRGAMIDELRSRDWMPRSVRRKAREIDSTISWLEQKNGRAPTEVEVAAQLDMSLEEYWQVLSDTNSGHILPLDDLLFEAREPNLDDEHHEDTPLDNLVDEQQREMLITAIDNLPEREKMMMALYYQEEMNLKEIGEILGVSESRVCQIHSQAISRLRSKLHE